VRPAALVVAVAVVVAGCGSFRPGHGGYAQTYYAAPHNWVFREYFPEADHLFNGFDYGHAILYGTLLDRGPRAELDGAVFHHVTADVLRRAPAVPLEERAIAPAYATLLPEIVAMFEWAHMLHRQLYDVLSDPRIAPEARAKNVRKVLDYYRTRPDLAFSVRPKSMELMEGQPYSLVFRRIAPRYNALIWSYHWLQMVVYDALLASESDGTRRADIDAAIGHFWAMNDGSAPRPTVMPMSAAIAPAFTAQFGDAAAVFDNLHALHDVISDILASTSMSRGEKRSAALVAASRYRDSTTAVLSEMDWLEMSRMMGVENMGGSLVRRSPAH
jgi:hypothetical protein